MEFKERKENIIYGLNQQIKIIEDTIDELEHCDTDCEVIEAMIKNTQKMQKINAGNINDTGNRKEK